MKGAIRTVSAGLIILALTAAVSISAQAEQKLSYRDMIDEVGGYLNEALSQYKKGNIQEAKQKAQAAYFEVYENLEGPIRINISAKKNVELEEDFVAVRNMIAAKEPAAAIEKRIKIFMYELRALIPELEGGVELVAEATNEKKHQAQGTESKAGTENIGPVWLQALENIRAGLGKALDAYRKGDSKRAAELVIQTQFDDYKNSLLETAVRRHVSQKKDFENNSGFSEIAALIQRGNAPDQVEIQISGLIKVLRADLPGLPIVEGAVSKREAERSAVKEETEKNWSKVTADLFSEINKSIVLYKKGETKSAVTLMQDAYFDVFEASGMEAKIGARDANFKAALEGHFSIIISRMKKGVPPEEMEGPLTAMRADFDKAVAMLGKGKDSPMALFFYSLMIILREGIEAILIITAIIAYLVKTGHSDKLRVIYNGCISALVLSGITAVLVKWVFKASAASQEILEGATMLLASAVLFSVSYWLISKAEAQKWMAYIKGRVSDSLTSGSLKALWFAAFLAVYREGAETVLFYQALASDSGGSGLTAVAGGFVLGSVLLGAIYLGMRYGAVKLKIRPFFLCTGVLLYYMVFVFAGKGVMELIEGKLFEPSLVSWIPSVPFIGVYPYVQTLIPQFLIILAAVAGLAVMMKRRSVLLKDVPKED